MAEEQAHGQVGGASQIRNAARSRTAGREHRRQGKMRAGNHRETLLQRNDVVRNVLEMLLWRLASRLYAKPQGRGPIFPRGEIVQPAGPVEMKM